jgi:hypothetical protein
VVEEATREEEDMRGEIDVQEVMRVARWHRERARRAAQIELDNALWCWRQAKTPDERRDVLRVLGRFLLPYWEAKRRAIAEGWARERAWRQARARFERGRGLQAVRVRW